MLPLMVNENKVKAINNVDAKLQVGEREQW
jgi:hypothetical protein